VVEGSSGDAAVFALAERAISTGEERRDREVA
jgi:hypothetical protein